MKEPNSNKFELEATSQSFDFGFQDGVSDARRGYDNMRPLYAYSEKYQEGYKVGWVTTKLKGS